MLARRRRMFATLVLAVVVGIGLITSPVAAQPTPQPTPQANPPAVDGMGASMQEKLRIPRGPAARTQPTGPNTIQPEPTFEAECPSTITCIVVPAAYIANNGDVADYGNYDITNRPSDMAINSIVIHDTEGDLQSVLEHFKDPKAYVSCHYVVDRDGTVYQMVQNKNMAWHAGNWHTNMHSECIEHVGHAALGGTEYTTAMYEASAQLVRYLTDRYHIPRDRAHIIGHDNVQAIKASQIAGMHTDPGPYWDWESYMTMIGAPVLPPGGWRSSFVTVAPHFQFNTQLVTGCSVGDNGCAPTTPQPANFVYLRTEPRVDAPLFSDPVLGQGTTDITNNAARVFYGQTFAVAGYHLDRGGMWFQVWVNGKTGWFYSPWHAWNALPASGNYITPKAGLTTIPVYGRPVPENTDPDPADGMSGAYPESLLNTEPAASWIPRLAPQTPLPYTMKAGQQYKVLDLRPPNDHFYAWASDASYPYDHTVFRGTTQFIQIQFGNRIAFVKASDVNVR
jgi:hypothetical protein